MTILLFEKDTLAMNLHSKNNYFSTEASLGAGRRASAPA